MNLHAIEAGGLSALAAAAYCATIPPFPPSSKRERDVGLHSGLRETWPDRGAIALGRLVIRLRLEARVGDPAHVPECRKMRPPAWCTAVVTRSSLHLFVSEDAGRIGAAGTLPGNCGGSVTISAAVARCT